LDYITNKKYIEKFLKIFISFIIPVLILTFVYYTLEIDPFGNKTLLTTDLKNQYISFFSYFKSSLQGQDSLLYSFSKTMSGNMVGLVGYYLISPFNILFLFADVSNFTIILTIITLLKIGTAGITMYIYLRTKNLKNIMIYALSTAYALSSYMLAYQQNIMWLDAVILLPIVVLGIDYILKKGKTYIYIISLALTIMTNYYIGYMVCLFSVLYFLASSISQLFSNNKEIKSVGLLTIKFLIASLLAGGISSIIWLPSILSYSGSSKVAFDISDILDTNPNFSLLDFLSKFIIGATNTDQIVSGLPNIFIPVSLLIIGLLFFMNSKISNSSKLKYGLLIAIMYISFNLVGINKIWHGFSEPTWFPYRNSFIFIFLLISIVAIQIKKFSAKSYQLVLITLLGVFTILNVNKNEYSHLTSENIKLTLIILLFSIFLISFTLNKKINKKYIFIPLLALTMFETSLNSFTILGDLYYYEADYYENFVENSKPTIDKYKSANNEFYRIEKTFSFSENDPLLLNYNGLSHYSSNETDNVKEFLGNMGYRNNGNWSIYSNGSSLFADSLLGIKYVVTDNIEKNYLNKVEDVDNQNQSVYYNPYAFPLGFTINNNDYTDISEEIQYNNPFQYQNELINKLFNMNGIHEEISADNINMEITNLDYTEKNKKHIFTKIDTEEAAFITFNIEDLSSSDQLNVFFMNDDLYNSGNIYFDDQYYGKILSTKENNIYTYNTQSEEVEVKIKLQNDEIAFKQSLFYINDINHIQELYSTAVDNQLNITEFSPTEIIGEVPTIQSSSILNLTMPYDESWKVTVDGEQVNTMSINDVLLGVEIPPESKNVELVFIPKGSNVSIVIFIGSIIIVGYIFYGEKHKNIN